MLYTVIVTREVDLLLTYFFTSFISFYDFGFTHEKILQINFPHFFQCRKQSILHLQVTFISEIGSKTSQKKFQCKLWKHGMHY